ncbi:MAG: ParA family protein [Candidatus Hydrothermales bacterium]
MKIISVCNQKGGVGKTTTCMNLGHALSLLEKKVLLIDLDVQANLTSGLGLKNIKKGVFEILAEEDDLEGVIVPRNDFWVAPSTGKRVLYFEKEKAKIFSENLKKLNFDYVIIDTPPSLGDSSIFALTTSNFALIPVQSEYFALEGLVSLLSTIKYVKAHYNPNIAIMGFIITMHDSRLLLSKKVESELRKAFGEKVFKTIIPRNVRLAESPSFGKTIFEYDKNSTGAESYLNLAKEVLQFERKKEPLRTYSE